MGTRKRQFLFIFVFTFLYKLSFAWRSGIKAGWQDELSWNALAQRETFFGTITQFDSGYPTPLLRAFSFALAHTTVDSFLVWHIFILLVVSGSLASLAYSRIIDSHSRHLVAAIACSYPSFDLLLLHNLGYWTFIPLFVVLSNILYGKTEVTTTVFISIICLIILTAKPQLLIFTLILSVCLVIVNHRIHKSLIVVIALMMVIIILGRSQKKIVDLNIDPPSIINFVLTANSHFINVVAPIVVMGVYASSRFFKFPILILLFYAVSNIIAILRLVNFADYIRKSRRISILYLAFLALIGSLYLFPNSGWSQNNLLVSSIYPPLFSRHYLPIVLSIGFILLLVFRESNWTQITLALAAVQSTLLQILLFHNLYMPI